MNRRQPNGKARDSKKGTIDGGTFSVDRYAWRGNKARVVYFSTNTSLQYY